MRSAESSQVTDPAPDSEDMWSDSSAVLAWLMLVGGLVGWLASFVLTMEKFEITADSSYVPSCSISPILNCGSVMTTPQASALGFPNSLLGVTGFAVVAAIGAAALAGARFRPWFWWGLQFVATAATVFVHWLITQSIYTIGALCPYCMVVWAVTVPIFWYVSLRNLSRLFPGSRPALVSTLLVNHTVPVTLWALVIAGLITHQFWWYWSGLL